jgi:RecA-family ATPase
MSHDERTILVLAGWSLVAASKTHVVAKTSKSCSTRALMVHVHHSSRANALHRMLMDRDRRGAQSFEMCVAMFLVDKF